MGEGRPGTGDVWRELAFVNITRRDSGLENPDGGPLGKGSTAASPAP